MYAEKTVAVYLDMDAYEILQDAHRVIQSDFGALGCKDIIKCCGRHAYGITAVHLYVNALPYIQSRLQVSSDMHALWHCILSQIQEREVAEDEFFRMEKALDDAAGACRQYLSQGDALTLSWEGRLLKTQITIRENEYKWDFAEGELKQEDSHD